MELRRWGVKPAACPPPLPPTPISPLVWLGGKKVFAARHKYRNPLSTGFEWTSQIPLNWLFLSLISQLDTRKRDWNNNQNCVPFFSLKLMLFKGFIWVSVQPPPQLEIQRAFKLDYKSPSNQPLLETEFEIIGLSWACFSAVGQYLRAVRGRWGVKGWGGDVDWTACWWKQGQVPQEQEGDSSLLTPPQSPNLWPLTCLYCRLMSSLGWEEKGAEGFNFDSHQQQGMGMFCLMFIGFNSVFFLPIMNIIGYVTL